MKLYSLGKTEKLKGVKSVKKLFDQPSYATVFPIKAIYLVEEDNDISVIKAGFTVPKRKFNKAHDRNKIKRGLREGYRLNKTMISNSFSKPIVLSIMFVYIGENIPNTFFIKDKMEKLMNKIIEKIAP